MRMYTRAKRKRFHHKIESRMFLFISGRHIGVRPMYTNMATPYKAL